MPPRQAFYDPRPAGQFLGDLTRDLAAEQGLVQRGAIGQQAGPRGLGPEPPVQHEPGGELLSKIQHPAWDTLEHLFRVLPEDSWMSPAVSPQKPVKFELGSFKVPDGQYFLVSDYEFTAFRQSGIDPFDFVQAEAGRFSGYMGFDITLSGRRMSNLFYQLDPAPVQYPGTAFQPSVSTEPRASQFNRAAANSFGSTAGEGSSILPVRPTVQGARGMPFTLIAQPGTVVALSCIIFRRVMTPLACLQGSMAGYTIHANTMSALLNRVRPR